MYLDYLKTKQAVGEFGDVVEIKDPNAFSDSGILAQMPESISDLVENTLQYNGKTFIGPNLGQTKGVRYNNKTGFSGNLREDLGIRRGSAAGMWRRFMAHGFLGKPLHENRFDRKESRLGKAENRKECILDG